MPDNQGPACVGGTRMMTRASLGVSAVSAM